MIDDERHVGHVAGTFASTLAAALALGSLRELKVTALSGCALVRAGGPEWPQGSGKRFDVKYTPPTLQDDRAASVMHVMITHRIFLRALPSVGVTSLP